MADLRTVGLSWLRHKLAWSNSRQAWEERLGLALVVGGVALLLAFGGRLPLGAQAVLWGCLVLALAVLMRRGWFTLFGPVLFYDLVRIGRRTRYTLLRCLYALLLLALLCWIYWIWLVRIEGSTIRATEMAAFAESFFYTFMCVQFVTVAILTPAYTAGAIADEKDRRTLEFLLATDLRNREIVLSKLAARVANLLLIILTGLPILSFLQLLGGVDPGLVLAGFAATGLTMISLASLSIFCSVLARKPRDAIVLTYLTAVAYLVLSGMSWLLIVPLGLGAFPSTAGWTSPVTVSDLVEWLNAGNIIAGVTRLFGGGAMGKRPDELLPKLLRNYLLFHGVVAVVFSGWAVTRLRAVALKQTYGKARKRSWLGILGVRPRVGSEPVLWKEVFIEPGIRLSWIGWGVVGLLVLASLVPTGFIVGDFLERLLLPRNPWDYHADPWKRLAEEMNVFQVRLVGTPVACLLLLAVAVRAAGSVSGERDRQTLDALLTSPLDSSRILFGKWVGSIASVRWAWLWLGLIGGLGLITRGLHPLALPVLVAAWLVYAGFLAALGLWFSVVSRTTLRAIIYTIATALGAAFGHWLIWACCLPLLMYSHASGRGFEWVLKLQAGFTPPVALGWLAFYGPEFEGPGRSDKEYLEVTGFALLGLVFWAGAAAVLWCLTAERFRRMTGRGSVRRPERPAGPRRRPAPRPLPARPPSAPLPPLRLKGAIMIDEEWTEPPGPRGDGEAPPPSRGPEG
jgi:ABC-type transport system involved in multi-copper enzyme maturation permease subunit